MIPFPFFFFPSETLRISKDPLSLALSLSGVSIAEGDPVRGIKRFPVFFPDLWHSPIFAHLSVA